MREWSSRNQGKIQAHTIDKQSKQQANRKTVVRRYGLTLEDYDRMYSDQRGLCAICHQPETSIGRGGKVKHLAVDHDHVTNEVRQLLCNNCNRAIGLLKDDVSVLLDAIEYLRKHGVKT